MYKALYSNRQEQANSYCTAQHCTALYNTACTTTQKQTRTYIVYAQVCQHTVLIPVLFCTIIQCMLQEQFYRQWFPRYIQQCDNRQCNKNYFTDIVPCACRTDRKQTGKRHCATDNVTGLCRACDYACQNKQKNHTPLSIYFCCTVLYRKRTDTAFFVLPCVIIHQRHWLYKKKKTLRNIWIYDDVSVGGILISTGLVLVGLTLIRPI